jgi:hypothetical protein
MTRDKLRQLKSAARKFDFESTTASIWTNPKAANLSSSRTTSLL